MPGKPSREASGRSRSRSPPGPLPPRSHPSTIQLVPPGLRGPTHSEAEEVTQLLTHVLLAIHDPRCSFRRGDAAAFTPHDSVTHRLVAQQVCANIVELCNRVASGEFAESLDGWPESIITLADSFRGRCLGTFAPGIVWTIRGFADLHISLQGAHDDELRESG